MYCMEEESIFNINSKEKYINICVVNDLLWATGSKKKSRRNFF